MSVRTGDRGEGTLAEGTTHNSLTAWMANAKRGSTFDQRRHMTHYYYDLKARRMNNDSDQ